MNQTICNAISNMQVIEFNYDFHHRVVEPHTYGVNIDDHEVLSCYQIDGTSASGDIRDWKLFLVDRMRDVTISGQTFSNARPGYKRNDSRMKRIYCQL